MEIPNKQLITIKEALPFFEITSENTFRSWERRGQLPEKLIARIGNTIRIRTSVLEQYLNGDIA